MNPSTRIIDRLEWEKDVQEQILSEEHIFNEIGQKLIPEIRRRIDAILDRPATIWYEFLAQGRLLFPACGPVRI